MSGPTWLGFELLRPAQFAWLLAVPLALGLGLWALRARRRARRRLVAAHQEAHFLPGFSRARARARVALVTLAVFFAGVALLGPVRGFTLREVPRRGLDLVVCVDTSRSMLVQDLRPDRLTRTKREVTMLLDRLKGDRVALLAFSGDTRDVSPLTDDRRTLKWFLDALSTEDNVRGGTDLGAALGRGLELFDGRTGAHEAIVLLTDGEDLEGKGLEVARQASERGIRIYVVGMGTVAGGKIPDPVRGWVRDDEGNEVVSKLDPVTLREIASVSSGEYLSAADVALPLEELYDKRISRLEGRFLEDGKERIPHDRYQWPLAVALACMFIEALLRDRRQPRGSLLRARRPSASPVESSHPGESSRTFAAGSGSVRTAE